MLSKVILLKYLTNVDRYSSTGVGGLCASIFSSLQDWPLCVSFVCLVPQKARCQKLRGVAWHSHVSLNFSRMQFRVTHNVRRLGEVQAFHVRQAGSRCCIKIKHNSLPAKVSSCDETKPLVRHLLAFAVCIAKTFQGTVCPEPLLNI
jgi:hypothetical protein